MRLRLLCTLGIAVASAAVACSHDYQDFRFVRGRPDAGVASAGGGAGGNATTLPDASAGGGAGGNATTLPDASAGGGTGGNPASDAGSG
jgi:hypothetical protein